jgi:hypothetical protein
MADEDSKKSAQAPGNAGFEPVNVVEGIPDAAPKKPAWVYLVLGGIFLAWLAFLTYVYIAV